MLCRVGATLVVFMSVLRGCCLTPCMVTGTSNNTHISEFDSAHATMWLVLPQKIYLACFPRPLFQGGQFVVGMGSAIVEESFCRLQLSSVCYYARTVPY